MLPALPSRRSQLCAAERAAHGPCSERNRWSETSCIKCKSLISADNGSSVPRRYACSQKTADSTHVLAYPNVLQFSFVFNKLEACLSLTLTRKWNTRLKLLIQSLGQKYHSDKPSTSMNIFEFDTNGLFTSVIANPASTPQTVNIKNTTGWCPAFYDNGVRQGASTYNSSCGSGLTLGEYVWLNSIHPTLTMYQAMAAQIAKMFGD